MAVYDRAAATANRILKKYGMPVTLRRVTAGEYDPATGAAAQTTEDFAGTGAVFNFKQTDIDGTRIKTGDQQLYLSPFQSNGQPMPLPTTDDLILIGDAVYSIQPSGQIAPAGVAVLYQLHIRGA